MIGLYVLQNAKSTDNSSHYLYRVITVWSIGGIAKDTWL